MGNLNLLIGRLSYHGCDQVMLDNKKSLYISSTSSAQISPNIDLKSVLHVPNSAKNLFSISQLTSDHKCLVKFFDSSFYGKDKASRCILLRGRSKDGLCVIDRRSPSHQGLLIIHAELDVFVLVILLKLSFYEFCSLHLLWLAESKRIFTYFYHVN